MGCSGCAKRRAVGVNNRRRYKYLTQSQINNRFAVFKEKYCIGQINCEEINECDLNNYRKCSKRKEVFELL
jgi:hypothetical protein